MPKKSIDSSPFREREAPLPFWFADWCLKDGKEDHDTAVKVMERWREAFDVATRLTTLPYSEAVNELNMQSDVQLMLMIRARWDALRARPIDWVVETKG